MARVYKTGEFEVLMHYRCYAVQEIESSDGTGYSTDSSKRVAEYYDRYEAHRLQYMLNGWGFPEFTLPKNVTDVDYMEIATDILSEHIFNRTYEYEYKRHYGELKAKAEADMFKLIISRIKDTGKREGLKKEWIAKYHESMNQEPVMCY